MTLLSIIMVLVLGAATMLLGFLSKRLWIKLVSIIPIGIALFEIISLLFMGE